MIKVKLITPRSSNLQLIMRNTLRQTPNFLGIWQHCKFHVNQDNPNCDYCVVFGGLTRNEIVCCPPENTIFIVTEPKSIHNYDQKFLSQFATIITCQRKIKHRNVIYSHPGHTWFVNKNYDELSNTTYVRKSKTLSIITSTKQFTEGHKKRYEFALQLKDYFGNSIDLFGRGIKNFEDKWDVLAPYKYSIAIENSVEPDYFTEKLGDCFLAHSFPFYYGCPNIDDYYNLNSLIKIDINNFAESCSIIEKIINNKEHYNKHLRYLIESKNRYLNHYSLVPLIADLIDVREIPKEEKARKIIIKPEDAFINSSRFIISAKKGLKRLKII